MNTDMQNIESDEISLKELIEKGKEWFAYLLSMEDYFISWNQKVLGLTIPLSKPVYTATLSLL
jgi:hypothetical protein